MSADKYPCIFSRQMATIVYLCLNETQLFKFAHRKCSQSSAMPICTLRIPGELLYEKDRGSARRTRGQEKSFWYLLGC